MHKPELNAPAGNLDKLKTVLLYGADAVYLSGKKYGLRYYAGNFSNNEFRCNCFSFNYQSYKFLFLTISMKYLK